MRDPDTFALNLPEAGLLPSAPVGDRRRWLWRAVAWSAVAAAFGLVLHYDVLLMQWRTAVFPEGPQGLLKQVFYGFRDFGQVLPIVVTILIILRIDKRRRTIVATLLIAQLLAGIGYNTGKLTIARYRPHVVAEQVAPLEQLESSQTWIAFAPNNREHGRQSFPSGHSGGAFAFAGVLAWFYPPLASIFWFLAAGCALSRYVDGVHWLSDCMAGAAIGYLGAWLALRPYLWGVPFSVMRGRKPKPVTPQPE